MKKLTLITSAAALTVAALGSWNAATALPPAASALRYEITVTNVTKGQILGPVAVASHNSAMSLFDMGAPASPELAFLAEEGDPTMLLGALNGNPDVLVARTNGAATMPGESSTIVIAVRPGTNLISLASMLISTNDGFIGLRDIPAPVNSARYFARVYDAGSEFNSEDCAFIPGPPCGNGGAHDPTPAEGYVRIHEGVHGIGTLSASDFGWDGPAAEITIRRMNP